MPHTEHELSELKRVFSKRRRNQRVLAAIVLPVVVAMAVTQDREAGTVFGVSLQLGGTLVFALVVSAILFSMRNWRCPACAAYLGRAFNPRQCQRCGVELRA